MHTKADGTAVKIRKLIRDRLAWRNIPTVQTAID